MLPAPIEIFKQHVPGINAALSLCGETHTLEDVMHAVLNDHAQVWGNEKALIVTELVDPFVHFWIATGQLDEVVKLSHQVMKWARRLGYTKASLTGRKGWVRALQHEGWREQAVLMEKDISDG